MALPRMKPRSSCGLSKGIFDRPTVAVLTPPKTPCGKGLEAPFSLGASRGTTDGSARTGCDPRKPGPKARSRMKRGRVHPGRRMDTTARGLLSRFQETIKNRTNVLLHSMHEA